jgi:hypothetical protein
VLSPGEVGYDDQVSGFNVAVTHAPQIVVAAECAEDVLAAVRYAAGAGLPVAVQATGHRAHLSFTGGLLINTQAMNSVSIDPVSRTATVGAGTRWRAVLDAAAPYGLGGLCGSTSNVSVVGYTLGGGLPVLGRAFGFAADRLRSVQLVTADGQLRTVDASSDPELLWALRGAGAGLGIVTSMTFELVELSQIAGGGIFYPGEHAAAVLAQYAQWIRNVPEQLCSSLAFLRLPPVPDLPEPLRGQFTMHLRIAYPGELAELAALLEPMRRCAPAVIDAVGELAYPQLDAIHQDPDHPVPFAERGCLLEDLSPALQQVLIEQAGPDSSCPLLLVELRHLGGALRTCRTGGDDAVGGRDAGLNLFTVGVLAGPAAGAVLPGLAAVHDAVRPHATGRTFINLAGPATDAADRARAWAPAQDERLRRVKATLDPGNLFWQGYVAADGTPTAAASAELAAAQGS